MFLKPVPISGFIFIIFIILLVLNSGQCSQVCSKSWTGYIQKAENGTLPIDNCKAKSELSNWLSYYIDYIEIINIELGINPGDEAYVCYSYLLYKPTGQILHSCEDFV